MPQRGEGGRQRERERERENGTSKLQRLDDEKASAFQERQLI
jgi:hypothetical protein